MATKTEPGRCYLVGAGPGDLGLVTLRARQLIERADVVVYDYLCNPEMLQWAPESAELIYVGKKAGAHTLKQNEINALLVEKARSKQVVRLKGGDPFLFGRGGEEAQALGAAAIPFEVVPGVTSAIAAPAYAGIPVTHRGIASSVTFATGHEDPQKPESALDWGSLARVSGTLVLYMGVGRMEANFQRLIDAGRPPETPAAVIQSGTRPRQRTVVGTLATLPCLAVEAKIGTPALVVVGEVVSLRKQLAWFDRRPLFGRRVVVTRARAQASDFSGALEALGAEVIQFPAIRITDPGDPTPLLKAAAAAERYQWVVFTSVNGVTRFWDALHSAGRDTRALGGVRVCAIGPATGDALRARGVVPELVPERYVAESVLEALLERGVSGERILLPRAEVSRDVLPDGLRAAGAEVSDVAAYRTVVDGEGAGRLREELNAGRIDLITFTASSTVSAFVERVGTGIGTAKVASIGPITSRAARDAGIPVHLEAAEFSIPGLVRVIGEWFRPGRGEEHG
ncbi:MAG: uroporphyrinogen-III C-methyltransferase [Verrucomicrobiota bacterium]|nr:uroporphyrinogen-III C-methyltransferase [Verrucomicrobiota bacterium]